MLEWTGERHLPWAADATTHYEHLHRYRLASQLVAGKRVLDLACGEGYGAALMALSASRVVGLDLSAEAVRHATSAYPRENLRFLTASVAALPFHSRQFDVVVGFEVLEHVQEQEALVAEARRVIEPEGLFVLSTPNKEVYSDRDGERNPFHCKELYLPELEALLRRHFEHVVVLGQKVAPVSLISRLGRLGGSVTAHGIRRADARFELCEPASGPARYFLALASARPLPAVPADSIQIDQSDAMVLQTSAYLSRLETEVAAKDRHIAEVRDYVTHLERELAAKKRYIDEASLVARALYWVRLALRRLKRS